MSSEKQTLILAGEAVPLRPLPHPLTVVATPADVTYLLAQGEQTSGKSDDILHRAPAVSSHRSISYGVAGAYARTQALAGGGNFRTAIIDTYA